MTDRQDKPNEAGRAPAPQSDHPQRSIPDGGLGASMPAWLQQPPSWKSPPVQAAGRTLPAPDTSAIDPGSLLGVDDLPRWLREIATPAPEPADVAPEAALPDDATTSVAAGPVTHATWPQPGRTRELATGEFVPTRPSEPHQNRDVDVAPFDPGPNLPWWMSDRVLAVLLLAILLTIAYVILAASGVL